MCKLLYYFYTCICWELFRILQPYSVLLHECLSKNHLETIPLHSQTYILVVKYCPNPCGKESDSNNPMCIRTCSCPKNFVLNKDGKCIKMPQTVKENISKIGEGSLSDYSKSRRDLGNFFQYYG